MDATTKAALADALPKRLATSGDCLLYTGPLNQDGYGRINAGRRGYRLLAHRVAWELAHGPIPPGRGVRHLCEHLRCCNVDHLTLGPTGGKRKRSLADRLWSRTERVGECLRFTGPQCPLGYGNIGLGGRGGGTISAHRAAYQETYGPIPDGLHVCHHCDNPWCVEPTHLFLGTRSDNMRDASEKDRLWILPEATRRTIAAAYRAGESTQAALAAAHGVSQQSVSNWCRLYAP